MTDTSGDGHQYTGFYNLVVVGGGPAGVTAALRARELGATVALVERGALGGTCTNDGCAPTRALAKSARLMRDAQQFDDYGLVGPPPTVDFGAVVERAMQTVARLHEKKQLLRQFEESGVTFIPDRARFVDPHTLALAGGGRLRARNVILAVGGHARRLTFPGSDLALTHHDVWHMTSLPRSVVIAGAAATGCQLASIFDAFGAQVTLLDVAPHILATEDPLLSQVMARAFRDSGMNIVTGIAGIERLVHEDGQLALYYTQDGESRAVRAESVILAVGWVGNLEGLGLQAAGVDHARGYIQTNDYLQTSVPHILAAGDVTGRMMLVQTASQQGRLAAENAMAGPEQLSDLQNVPHGGFTDPEYGSVGLTEPQAREREQIVTAVVPYAHLDRAVIDDRPTGFCKLVVSAETRQVLGAHIVGEQALEAIQLVAAGMSAGITVEQLAELELAYPTYTAVVGLAARQATRKLGLVTISREWRAVGGASVAEWEVSLD